MVGSRPLGAETTSDDTSQGDTISLLFMLLLLFPLLFDGNGVRLLSG